MNVIDRIKQAWAGLTGRAVHDNPQVPLSSDDAADLLGWNRASSGVIVNTDSALSYSPVWSAVDLISSDISRLPLIVYKRVETPAGEGKQRARRHPAYRLLRKSIGDMTSNLWLVRMVAHASLFGNAYSRIHYVGSTSIIDRLEWLHSDRVEPKKENGVRYYVVSPDRQDTGQQNVRTQRVPVSNMFHLQGLAIAELGGLAIVHFARNTIGRALSAEGYGDDYFKNGGPSVVFTHPGTMSKDARERWLRTYQDRHAGQGNRFRFGLFEDGMTAKEIGLSADDAMLIDMLQFTVTDTARFFKCPPHKLGHDARTAFASVEQENRSYHNSCLGGWISRIEYECNDKLFTPAQKRADSHFAEFKVDTLFRADTIDRMQAAAVAISNGIKSRNEVRAEENLDPYEGGDEFLHPLNLGTDDVAGEDGNAETVDQGNRAHKRELLIEQYQRASKRIMGDAKRRAKHPEGFAAWIHEIRSKNQRMVTEHLRASLVVCGVAETEVPQHVDEYLAVCCEQILEASRGSVADLEVANDAVVAWVRSAVDQILIDKELAT